MADFKAAFARTMRHEGGYVNDQVDRGGETYCGISRRFHPAWQGWVTIDNLRYAHVPLDTNPQLQAQVEQFYRVEYWDKIRGDDLPELIGRELFDCAVLYGIGTAARFLQAVLGVTVDGAIGPKTLEVTKASNEESVVAQIKERRKRYHLAIVQNNPSQEKFLAGWLRRAEEGVA